MRRHDLSGLMAATTLLLALWAGVPGDRLTWAADPDFSNVSDILNGRRHLLRTDDLVFGYQGAFGLFPTQDSAIVSGDVNLQVLNDGSDRYSQPAVVGARLFNIASDVAVTLVEDRNNDLLQWRLDTSSATVASGTVGLPVNLPDPASFLSVVAGDFTGDGLDEVVVFLTAVGANGSAIVGTAVDPQDPSKGLRFGPVEQFFGLPFSGSGNLFNGNNHLEPLEVTTAAVLGQPRVFVAGPTDYLADNCPTRHSGLSFESYTIDPQSLALSSAGTFSADLPEGNDSCLHFVDITAGRFSTPTHDQLLVAYGVEGGNVKVLPFDINAQGIAVQQQIYDSGYGVGGGQFFIRSGRFD
jgi:hypothetical protein